MNSQVAQQQAQMMQSMEGPMVVMSLVLGFLMATAYQVTFLILNNRKAVRDYLSGDGDGGAATGQVPAYGQGAPSATPPTDSPW